MQLCIEIPGLKKWFEKNRFLLALSIGVTALISAGCDSSGSSSAQQLEASNPGNPLIEDIQNIREISNVDDLQADVLLNGDFSDPLGSLPGWSACKDASNLNRVATGNGYELEIAAQECVIQVVKVTPGTLNTFSCEISAANPNKWSGMAITYYIDDFFEDDGPLGGALQISESVPAVADSSSFNGVKTTTGLAPDAADFAVVWYYTDSAGKLSNCSFTSSPAVPMNRNADSIDYEYSAVVREGRFRDFGDNFGDGFDYRGFGFNGFDELQSYPYNFFAGGVRIDGGPSGIVLNGSTGDGENGRRWYVKAGLSNDYLNVLVKIDKHYGGIFNDGVIPALEIFEDSFPVAGDLWNDDSMEIYINAGNEPTAGYDNNDFSRVYGFPAITSITFPGTQPEIVTGINSRLSLTNDAVCNVDRVIGGVICEARFSLEELGIADKPVAEIGFDIHVNFDDDGGDRDAKYSWCSGDTLPAWRDMSTVKCSLILEQAPLTD